MLKFLWLMSIVPLSLSSPYMSSYSSIVCGWWVFRKNSWSSETENVVEQRFNVAPGSKTLLQNPKTLPRRCARVYKDMFSDSVKYWKSFQQSSQVSLLKDYLTKKTRSRCPRRSVSTRSIDLLQDNFCFDDWRKRMIIMTTFSFLITLRSLVLCDC